MHKEGGEQIMWRNYTCHPHERLIRHLKVTGLRPWLSMHMWVPSPNTILGSALYWAVLFRHRYHLVDFFITNLWFFFLRQ